MASSPLADANNGTMVVTTAVNVRPAPNTSQSRLGVLYPGQRITAVGSSNGWTQVSYNGRTAYISSQYLRSAGGSSSGGSSSGGSSSSGSTAYTTAALNLRTGPGTNNASRAVVPRGTALSLTGTVSSGWSQVTHNGATLWASQAYLSQSAPSGSLPAVTGKGRATAALLIRTTSGSNYQTIETVPVGTILETTGVVQNGMAQIVFKNNVRWVNNQYLQAVVGDNNPTQPQLPSTSTRYATANLNIWTGSTGDARVGLISKGSAIEVTGTVTSGRAQIVHNGTIRWVTAQYTSTTAPSASPAPGSGNSGGSLNRGYSSGLDQTNANVQRIVRHVWDNWTQIKTMYGWRRDVTPDHPAGRAVDIMIPNWNTPAGKELGWKIANYYRSNASEFRVHYIIFEQKIWNIQRDGEGWRPMADRGNNTANHMDHIHITTYDN